MFNNETIGISFEVAIADAFNVEITPSYRSRGSIELVQFLTPHMENVFEKGNIPHPEAHTAEAGNPIDFQLEDGSTLSLKTNKGNLGKVAPQIIGQPTAKTFFEYFSYIPEFDGCIHYSWEKQRKILKEFVLKNPDILLNEYLKNLFHADHYLHFYKKNGTFEYLYIKGSSNFYFDKSKITFTRDKLETWKESTTVKYEGKSIGEFQIHNNRDCFKFRFNIKNLLELFN